MNEADETALSAEVVALQAVLMAVFRRMAHDRPELVETFRAAFEDAESMLTGVAMRMGVFAPRESMVGALKVIEELRAAVIRDESPGRPRNT